MVTVRARPPISKMAGGRELCSFHPFFVSDPRHRIAVGAEVVYLGVGFYEPCPAAVSVAQEGLIASIRLTTKNPAIGGRGATAPSAVGTLAISFSRHLDRIRLSRIFMIGDDYKDDRFEWSRSKAAANAKKHGVTFDAACKVFDDPFALEFEDRTERYKEQRLITIGIGPGGILLVAHTERGNRTRIISARQANAAERRKYRDENQRW